MSRACRRVDWAGVDHAGQVLDVDLMHDACARGHDLEVVEGRLAPPEKLVPLAIALILDLDIAFEGIRGAEQVGDDRVIDDQLCRCERVDLGRVPPEFCHGLAHGREVDDAGNPGEVLHDDTRRGELDFGVGLGLGHPGAERFDLCSSDVDAVLGAQEILEQHFEAERERGGSRHPVEPKHLVIGRTDGQVVLRIETVDRTHVIVSLAGVRQS